MKFNKVILSSVLGVVLIQILGVQALACTVSATALSFGPINPLAGAATATTATVTVDNCAEITTTFAVALSSSESGAFSPRAMTSGTHVLEYDIYLDPNMSQVWGDGTFGAVWSGSADSSSVTKTAYGRVPNQPQAYPGTYTDRIMATVTF